MTNIQNGLFLSCFPTKSLHSFVTFLIGEVVPVHAMKAYKRSRGTAPLIPNLNALVGGEC